jgi:hypothetical protein
MKKVIKRIQRMSNKKNMNAFNLLHEFNERTKKKRKIR